MCNTSVAQYLCTGKNLSTQSKVEVSEKSIYLKKFGLHIKKLREAKGLTQFQVSIDMNKGRQSL